MPASPGMASAACVPSTNSLRRPPWAYTRSRFACPCPILQLRRPVMIHIPVLRWGEPYKSLDTDRVVHFETGEVLAEASRANGGLVERDMRFARRARDVLREIPIAD